MFDVIVEFPKMKVGVATRGERVVEIRYLPPAGSVTTIPQLQFRQMPMQG
jgi:hypothetical protein